jgi:hypothetical protein
MNSIPDLEPHCGSWIIADRETGEAVFETWNPDTAARVNQDKYIVQTAAQHLAEINDKANLASFNGKEAIQQ